MQEVLAVPVAGVVEDGKEFVCAVKAGDRFEKRVVTLGKSDDRFVEIVEGLEEGEQIFLNPVTVLGETLSRDLEQRLQRSGNSAANK